MTFFNKLIEKAIVFAFSLLLLEGLFHKALEIQLQDRNSTWTKITPYRLFPSEILFYGPVLILGGFLFLTSNLRILRRSDSFFLIILLSIGGLQAFRGWIRQSNDVLWLEDLRQLFLMMIFAPIFATLGTRVRIAWVLDWFSKIATIIAVLNGLFGLMLLLGLRSRGGEFDTHFSAGQILVIPYSFELARGMLTGRIAWIRLSCLAFGIIAPLEKPVLATIVFAMASIAFLLPRLLMKVQLSWIKAGLAFGASIAITITLVYSFAGREARDWLSARFLKTNVKEQDRDISSGRFEMWEWGIDRFFDDPLIGVGLGDRRVTYGLDGKTYLIPLHNLSIELLCLTGILGITMFGLAFVIYLQRLRLLVRSLTSEPINCAVVVAIGAYALSMLLVSQLGRNLGVANAGLIFWSLIGFARTLERRQELLQRLS
ncbi:MAG: O-antigen ligase family protein [Pirellula sp.]|jgi:hypothetical protein